MRSAAFSIMVVAFIAALITGNLIGVIFMGLAIILTATDDKRRPF